MADLDIGRAVKAARKSAGLSQMKLSVAAGFTPSYVAKVETGGRIPSVENFVRLADATGVEPWKILRAACRVKAQMEGRG